MAGYIGSKSSVTLVDGYTEAEADAEFVAITGDSMTGGLTITTADNTNQLTIVSTDADANAGPNLNFRRNSASPADGDLTGQFTFTNNNDAGEGTDYATMYALSADVSNGSEDAAFYIKTMSAGTLRQRISLTDTATVFNEDSIDLDFRVESDNLTHALFVQGSDGNVGIGDSSPVSNNNFTALTITSTASTGGGQLYLKSSSVTGVVGADNATNAKLIVQTNTNHPIAFGTNGTERMRLDASGNFMVGKDTTNSGVNGSVLYNNGQIYSTATGHQVMLLSRYTNNGEIILFYRDGTNVGNIYVTTSSTSYNTSSDYRLKENVVDLTGASARVNQLNPSRFNFIADGTDTVVDGFLAHEVADVVPEAITGTKDAMKDEEYEVTPAVLDDDGNVTTEAVMGTRSVPDYQGIDQSKLVPLLTAALQEALTEIASLKTRVEALEA